MSDELIKIEERDSNKLVAKDYQDYAKYVLETRALPSVEDGLKLVQRRIIYAANQQPQKLMKTAALAGKVMLYHPHGDSSIYGTVVKYWDKIKAYLQKGLDWLKGRSDWIGQTFGSIIFDNLSLAQVIVI